MSLPWYNNIVIVPQMLARICLLTTLAVSVGLAAGCGQCGRRLFFFLTVENSSGEPIKGAAVALSCIDADDGSTLSDEDTANATDEYGETETAVHALNRECPEDSSAHSSYFSSCEIVVQATGYETRTVQLSSSAIDSLPEGKSVGQAGHSVALVITVR